MAEEKPVGGDLSRLVDEGKLDTVITAFPDHYGRLMGKRIPAAYFVENLMHAQIHTCNYLLTCDMEMEPLPGFAFSSWDQGYGDMQLKPDLASLRLLPWLPGSALVLCDLFAGNGDPVEMSPRRILQRQIDVCRQRGLFPLVASELEFYLFEGTAAELAGRDFRDLAPTTPYLIDYDILGTTRDEDFLKDVRTIMPLAGIPVESSKGEWGRGQHEVNLRFCDALEMADRHVIFKQGVKLLAGKHGRTATFMAKVSHLSAGSSCHIHTSFKDQNGRNAFWDDEAEQPSRLFGSFLAGCMRHAAHLSIFFAPTVNSYKRYRSASFAPVSIAWDNDNRTCGFRVVGEGQSLRIENRIPGADVNPYLAFAATLAAGLSGIDRKLDLPAPVSGNAYQTAGVPRVPATLPDAIRSLSTGILATEAFGREVIEHYRHLAEMEQAAIDNQVSDAELRRYLERI
ncbi:MAG TPA: glutamine synthetase family protein [Myxococcota bacterium]|nr:glutamine synthetase family protein [Myxococcota bacterium]